MLVLFFSSALGNSLAHTGGWIDFEDPVPTILVENFDFVLGADLPFHQPGEQSATGDLVFFLELKGRVGFAIGEPLTFLAQQPFLQRGFRFQFSPRVARLQEVLWRVGVMT